MQLVKAEHVIEYCNYREKVLTDNAEESKKLYNIAKIKYESGFFAKLFNLKFEDWGYWDFQMLDYHLSPVIKLRDRAIYSQKISNVFIEISDDSGFFTWCRKNNIPY